jgi:hypothetical protein
LSQRKKKYYSKKSIPVKEEDVQSQVCNYLRMVYPDVDFLSDASGLRLPIGLASKFSKLKSRRGIPDLIILEPRGGFCGLLLELKRANDDSVFSKKDGKLLNNKHVREQAKMLDDLMHKGSASYFAIGYDMARQIIDKYMEKELTISMKF